MRTVLDIHTASLSHRVIPAGPHATPRDTGNAFSAATDISEVDESAIWSFQKGSNTILEAQWVNADGCEYPG